ncbi:unnamed protein product [Owenia fusiformis]|uniref:L-ectoine synthase n=1 Tax=Owenia fusiformis TaxID=6347 RepID=A0A8J1XJJ2_OWEFU|nr:unnamed protein product [Owenia fusiformis]
MKVTVTNGQPLLDIGETGLTGKVLVSSADNVGFMVYDVSLGKGQVATLKPYESGYNHTYYVMCGTASVISEKGENVTIGPDTVMAMDADTTTTMTVSDDIRLSIGYVPKDPDHSPARFTIRKLSELEGTTGDRNMFWISGYSRRYLVKSDGYNMTVTNTTLDPNTMSPLHYKNHIEAVFMFKGSGKYVWNSGEDSHAYDQEKHDGTMFLINGHEAHNIYNDDKESQCICYFFPALVGHETHYFTKETTGHSVYPKDSEK